MLFNSVEFLLFFTVVTTIFFLVPKRFRNTVLLLSSYVFYLSWNVKLFSLIIFTTAVSFFGGLIIENKPKHRKSTAVISSLTILAVLFFFKYYNMFAEGLSLAASAFGVDFDITLNILLPIGISFYTFQTLSYIIDVYKGKVKAERNFFIYALFVSFFPQLVAGPIERPGDLIPQLRAEHSFSADNFISGIKLMLVGFFEKIAVADMLGLFVNSVYGNITSADGSRIALATLLFSVQILCDFRGYSDIARGTARIYGIVLSKNFDKPYLSGSVREFWRRWHITLSNWLRDYIYFPLGGGHVGFWRQFLNTVTVFAVSGLWHGASITFLIWGLLHALWQTLERAADKVLPKEKSPVRRVISVIITFAAVDFMWIFFRANTLSDAGYAVKMLFTGRWDVISLFSEFNSSYLYEVMLFTIVFGIVGRVILERAKGRSGKIVSTVIYAVMMWLTVGCFIYLHCENIPTSFIYFQF